MLAAAERVLQGIGNNSAGVLGEQLRAQRRRWAEDRPQIVLVSAFGAGKTTLIKHWFGLRQLPVGHKATTAAATRISYGNPDRVVLLYRQAVEVSLCRTSSSVDASAVGALEAWASAPDDFHVVGFSAIDGLVLAPETVTRMVAAARHAPRDVPSGVVVHFKERPPEEFSLAAMPEGWLAERITTPASALALAEAVCHVRDRRLRHVSILDTAGYGAAARYHQQSSADVLRRWPDVTIVLLDARRLDEPRARQVLAEVWGRIKTPDDVDAVLVGLTQWQSLLSSEAYDRQAGRQAEYDRAFHETVLEEKRAELDLLVSRRNPLPRPLTLPLEIGPHPSRSTVRNPGALLGIAVKRARIRPQRPRRDATLDLVGRVRVFVRANAEAASADHMRLRQDTDRRADRARALSCAGADLLAAVNQSAKTISAGFVAEEESLLAEVDTARRRKDIIEFLAQEYEKSRAECVRRLQDTAAAHTAKLSPFLGEGLPALTLPDCPSPDEQRRRITRVLEIVDTGSYWSRRILDAVAPTRTAEEPHEHARALVRSFVRDDLKELHGAVQSWWAHYLARHNARQAELERQCAEFANDAHLADQSATAAANRAATLAALSERAHQLDQEARLL